MIPVDIRNWHNIFGIIFNRNCPSTVFLHFYIKEIQYYFMYIQDSKLQIGFVWTTCCNVLHNYIHVLSAVYLHYSYNFSYVNQMLSFHKVVTCSNSKYLSIASFSSGNFSFKAFLNSSLPLMMGNVLASSGEEPITTSSYVESSGVHWSWPSVNWSIRNFERLLPAISPT